MPLPCPERTLRALAILLLVLPGATAARAQSPGEVESEDLIAAGAGGFSGPLDADDRFGGAVARLGDLDGDGHDDLLVGAPRDDDGATDGGALWVLFLDAAGAVRESRKISATQGGLGLPLRAGDRCGASVAALGDIDGDGVPDAAVGIPGSDEAAPDGGLVAVLRLQADGSVKAAQALGAQLGGFPGALAPDADAGLAVAGLGDLDGDGTPDLAIGSPRDESTLQPGGTVWILFLQPDGTVREGVKIAAGQGGFHGALASVDAFGSAIASLGPAGDGLHELAVGAPGDDEAGAEAGAIWLLRLAADGSVQGEARLAAPGGGLPAPLYPGDRLGRALAAPGDLDGDGRADLLAGLPGADLGGADRGSLRALLLGADASVAAEVVIGGLAGGFDGTLQDGDEFGTALAAAPAPGTGGAPRVFAGTPRDDTGAADAGACWVLELRSSAGEPPFAPPQQALAGKAGQPALLVPPPPAGDDFIGEPVVVVPKSGASISLQESLAGESGSLAFVENTVLATGENPRAAATGDFNADGQPDIVTANAGAGSISLLTQSGGAFAAAGSFAPKVDVLLPFDGQPLALRVGDVDGDGHDDVVTAGDGGLTTFLGNGQGDLVPGGFAPVALLADLALGDLDGDGDLDVLAASGAPATGPGAENGFATSLSNDGGGTFAAQATFAAGKAVASVLLADVDASGGADALLAVHELDGGPGGLPQGRIDLWLGDGALGFLPSPVFAGLALPDADGIHPRWGALGDVNGDGLVDALYTAADSLAFPPGSLLNEQPAVELTLLLGVPGGDFAASTIPTAYAGKGVAPLLIDLAPVPGDGLPDCILVWSQDTLAGGSVGAAQELQALTFLAALVGDGQGGFVDASPNQFLGAEEPGDPTLGEVGDAAGDAAGGLDLLIPDMATGSLRVWLGDGTGGLAGPLVVADVDPIDPGALPAGGIWQGGPRRVELLDLDGDPLPDVVISSRWDDLAGLFAPRAGFATRLGAGGGLFAGGEDVLLERAGDLAAGDLDADGHGDVVVTLRGEGGDAIQAWEAGPGGLLPPLPQQASLPAGLVLTGGLELADVDGLPGDEILTSGQTAAGGALVVVRRDGAELRVSVWPLGASWDDVRSLDAGRIDGDALADVALGLADGRLVLARGTGGVAFAPLATGPTAAALGGGALRLTEVDGDGRSDLVASSSGVDGTLDQAFVRELFGDGDGSFELLTLPGVSSVGPAGALRPAAGDLDGDGATDLVLAHGGSGTVSLLFNQLGTFAPVGDGRPGSAGLTPELRGQGYTTLGGSIELSVADALGGAQAMLWIGSGPQPDHPFLAMESVAAALPLLLSGAPGSPGAGAWSLATHLPNIDRFAGLELVLQVAVADPGATGSGPAGVATSNGLSFTILP